LAAAGSAIAFAWLHVSNQELYAESLQELVRIRTFLISGTAGVVFARIFWKKGLEAAIVAHGAADIVVHVVRPLVDSGWERIVS
jgi:membrane protease YdiL (CAAX protease family)